MKAFFTGSDYLLYILKETREIEELRKSKLETILQFNDDRSTGKKVTLKLESSVSHPDGIELSYIPKEPESWDHIKEINVVVNETALKYIVNRGRFGTRYDNIGNKIDIYWIYYQIPA